MRRIVCLSACLVVLAPAVFGQMAVRPIVLPDSVGVNGGSPGAGCDTALDKTYVPGVGAVSVMSGPDGRRVKRIDVVGSFYPLLTRVFVHQTLHKAYLVPAYDTLVTVIDTRADTILTVMRVPHPYWFIFSGDDCACLNTRNNKLYVWNRFPAIVVFDVTADTCLGVLNLPFLVAHPTMCYNPTDNKFYTITLDNQVAICDAGPDTLIRVVPAGNCASDIGYLEKCNKIYVTNYVGASITVIDGAGDSVVCNIPVPAPKFPVMNETNGKVYVGTAVNRFYIVDGFGDSVRSFIDAPHDAGKAWCARGNKAYLSYRGGVMVVDGASDSLLTDLPAPKWFCAHRGLSNPKSGLVFLSDGGTSEMLTINTESDSVVRFEVTGRVPNGGAATWSGIWRRLFMLNQTGDDLLSVGMAPGSPTVSSPLPWHYSRYAPPVFGPGHKKLYATSLMDKKLLALCCSTGTILNTVTLGPGGPTACRSVPRHRRVYCGTTLYIHVVDTDNDSIVRDIPCGGDGVDVLENFSAYSETSDKLYWPSDTAVLLIDPVRDSVVRSFAVAAHNDHIGALLWHPVNDRVYAAPRGEGRQGIRVIDCLTDSIVATVPAYNVSAMCSAVPLNRIYALTRDGAVASIDCERNQVTGSLYIRAGAFGVGLVYNPRGNKVYVPAIETSPILGIPARWWLAVIDCAADRVSARVDIGHQPYALAVDQDSGYVMVACENSVLYVIRDTVPSGTAEPRTRARLETSLDVRPNPALGGTVISACLPLQRRVKLCAHDAAGRLVSTLVDEELGPGKVEVLWDGTDGLRRLPAGTYFIRLEAAGEKLTRKLVLPR